MTQPTKKRRQSPESERYDQLKGKLVCGVLIGADGYETIIGVLRWVDRYTLGIYCEHPPATRARSNQVWIVGKSSIKLLGEA